ncbi:polysaccharide deacetylase family protein [Sediminicoccus sp. KRV36]|uniref:polysaccharide deacetylase family protein n=1 Tax=Sediminicoccus sp. KRV36 TaxID=3133721 RepID=UPI00201086FF|nr:polysaccharide deacetylase family protein [Sediminicoccus rosea]UPY35466.1 polysaccharide deacetylase family protein [Sediminicoccus rosea]
MDLPGGMPPAGRDLRGYGRHPPDPRWPDGARLALSFVVNVEEGAELSLASGDARNESVHEIREEVTGQPDPCMETHYAYGARAGLWRILDGFAEHRMRATFSACGRAVAHSPHLAQAPHAAGHEISAHGWRWESHANMPESTERAVIARTVAAIRDATGERPVGWHTRSAPSMNTRRLLLEEGGFLYDSDVYDDDLPRMHTDPSRPTTAGGHVILPYGFDVNDMRFSPGGGFVQAEDFSRYAIGAVDWLLREGKTAPKMLSIGLHLRIIGRPGRMPGLAALLAHVAKTPGIWVAPRRDIAAHWRNRAQDLP